MTSVDLTRAKVYSGVQALKCATDHLFIRIPICSKENDVFPQEQTEQNAKMPHVVVITGEVAAIFILHLRREKSTTYSHLKSHAFLYTIKHYLHINTKHNYYVSVSVTVISALLSLHTQ